MANHVCTCAAAGHCPIFNRTMTEALWEICGDRCPPERPCPPPAIRQAYLRIFREGPVVQPLTQASPGVEHLAHCRHRSPRPLRDERGKVRLVAY